MKTFCLSLLILLMIMSYSHGQNNETCACCSDQYKAFDFWIGDWTVYSTKDKILGTNKVIKMQHGCVLQENWEASNKTNTGTSYNFFDIKDGTWNQVWISSTGNVLELKGNINSDGAMVLKSELIHDSKGDYYNRITWSKNEDGTVTQLWEILDEDGEIVNNAFEGIYKKTR